MRTADVAPRSSTLEEARLDAPPPGRQGIRKELQPETGPLCRPSGPLACFLVRFLTGPQKAELVIAKLDRLARNVHFISGLMKTGIEFVAADMPPANRLTIHVLAAFAEHEREAISQRTKGALQAARKRGARLGNPRWQESIAKARRVKDPILPAPQLIEMMRRDRADGKTLRAIAGHLNALGLRTPRGSQWYASTVRNCLLAL